MTREESQTLATELRSRAIGVHSKQASGFDKPEPDQVWGVAKWTSPHVYESVEELPKSWQVALTEPAE